MKKRPVNEKNVFLQGIGKALHKRRIQLGISQEDLAEMADLNRGYISNMECGKRNISVYTLKKLSEALDIKITDLLKG